MEVFRLVVFWSHIILSSSLENLAYNKSATQSSNLHENKWLAAAAVDGNINQILTGNSCACTATFKPTVWWKVDLGNVYALSNVKIFYRNEGTLYRLTGFKLYVTLEDNFISSSPVYVNNNGVQEEPLLPANFTVTVATYGQYVILYKDRSKTCIGDVESLNTNFCALFELCEVVVLGCPKKKYDTDCHSDCPDNCLYDVCAVSDGKCYQCKAGYTGDMCDQPCVAGTYGIGCSQHCSGNCKGGTNCDVTTGICSSGCSDGYQGMHCNKTCSPGSYGSSCLSTCGSCRNNVTCNHVNGSCPTGCGLGVTGQYCRSLCSSGKYGLNCLNNCTGNCANETSCNPIDGTCQYGCTSGWQGNVCNQVCNSGNYGFNCQNSCTGNCDNDTACNKINGYCKYGCKRGWKGRTCNQVSDTNTSTDIQDLKLSFIIYGVISAVIICLLTAALILSILKRNRSLNSNMNTTEFEFSVSESNQKSSGNSMPMKSGCIKESKTKKYEELGYCHGERNNYETLGKNKEYINSLNKKTEELRDRATAETGGGNYEELHVGPSENNYESLRTEDSSRYANE